MKTLVPVYCILLLLAIWALPLCAQNAAPIRVQGRILNAADSTAVVYINVIDLQSKRGTLSGNDGSFAIIATPGDTLKVTGVGFDDAYMVVTESMIKGSTTLYLMPANYKLPQVTVGTFNKDQFRKQFKEMEIPEETVNLNLPENPEHVAPGDMEPQKPIAYVFGWDPYLEKVRKQNVQIKEWKKQEEHSAFVSKKYSKVVVQRVTGISDEQLDAFMKYCNMPDEFITSSQDYDIAMAIKDCYVAFLQLEVK